MPVLVSGQRSGIFSFLLFFFLFSSCQPKSVQHGAPDDRARRLADAGHIRTSSPCLPTFCDGVYSGR
ncbi:uncharacterized protein CCOS01_02521 [Colletotrichum costaricense]|uniref:Secreted protein n=1 Tax=Colletotrichum costaricense TaxID=1209916 RepID=A0AAI9Z854_9PEZI|nr:uncharacterized protein CCOS01_02521 [Colletotrichum costaricense]KAK1537201.1 hypothetical protein CCOS01_02521 [Colletotrichum costaricense]